MLKFQMFYQLTGIVQDRVEKSFSSLHLIEMFPHNPLGIVLQSTNMFLAVITLVLSLLYQKLKTRPLP